MTNIVDRCNSGKEVFSDLVEIKAKSLAFHTIFPSCSIGIIPTSLY